MGLINSIKKWMGMLFDSKSEEVFKVKSITSTTMSNFVNKCANIYRGDAPWLGNGVKTINMAQTVSAEIARLATLDIGVTIDGGARAKWLQKQVDNILPHLRDWVEYGAAYGTIVLKPNGDSIDVVYPDKYMVVSKKNGKITGMVFVNQVTSGDGKSVYTRLEYHRFDEDGRYVITNQCYKGENENDVSQPVSIDQTPWSMLQDEVSIDNLEAPLYAVLKMPGANNIDLDSPLGMPIYSKAIVELCDLDIAYSRNSEEIDDSARIVLMDTDLLVSQGGASHINNVESQKRLRERMELPKYVRNVTGGGEGEFYREINPTLNTSVRIAGINNILSQIGFKCGFSNGYFVFNEKTGMVTATQVESDDRRTLQTVADVRAQLEACMNALIYALSKFADLYDLAPVGEYEVVYDFKDLTQNFEEDKLRWWQYVQAQKVPAWRYFVKFEGMSEEEAKEMVQEAQQAQLPGLFETPE